MSERSPSAAKERAAANRYVITACVIVPGDAVPMADFLAGAVRDALDEYGVVKYCDADPVEDVSWPGRHMSGTVAALYVEKGGVYYGLPDVDPWDEERDARLYAGPWPVVAHPPCQRWCRLAGMIETRYGHKVGDDGGCFEAALHAVRTYGGVLEHPAHSLAWPHFSLPVPIRGGWRTASWDDGCSTEVEQRNYGHPLAKPTWLYAVGIDFSAPLMWGVSDGGKLPHRDSSLSSTARERMTIPTPLAFRDVLLDMARSARSVEAGLA